LEIRGDIIMKKKLKELAFLIGALFVVLFVSKQLEGIMYELLMEIRDKITSFSLDTLKQQLSGESDAVTYEGYMWNIGFILMWFVFQWIMLTRCRHIAFKVMPLAITIVLWALAEYINMKSVSSDFTAYALCYVTLHWMIGAWICCVIGCIKQQEITY